MVQTRPPARMGGPPPTSDCQSKWSPGGELVARTAIVPLTQGRKAVVPAKETPPSMSLPQAPGSAASCLPIPPKADPLSKYTILDLPATMTCPSGRSKGAIDISRSAALLEGQSDGAKYWSRVIDGESSRSESLSSKPSEAESTDPFPALTHTFPAASTTGAAPPIH